MSDVTETTVITEQPAPTRSPIVLVGAVVGALVLAALLWFFVVTPLFLGDDAGSSDQPTTPAAAAATGDEADVADDPTTDAPLADDAEIAGDLPLVTYEVFLERDPFDPVVPEPVAESTAGDDGTTDDGSTDDGSSDGGSTDGGTTDGGTTDGGTTDGGTTDGGTPTPSPTPAPTPAPGCTSGDQVVCDGRVVSLIEIRTGDDGQLVAIIQVDTTLYEVAAGEMFASNLWVQSITTDRVFILYGDDGFELREGDRVLK